MSSDPRADFSASGEFPASYDVITKTISAITCVFALAAAIAIHNRMAGAIMISVFALAYAYSPRAYRVSSQIITVRRLIGSVRVPLEDLRALRKIEPDDLRGCMRLWGSGGLFGYYGLFRTTRLGRCTWYATNRKKLIVAIGAKKTTVFSPDDVDGFLQAIRNEVPAPATLPGEPSVAGEVAGPPSYGRIALWIGISVVIAAAVGTLAAVLAVLHVRNAIR